MKYLADLLTLLRFLMAAATLGFLLTNQWGPAAIAFGIGLLSDAFDGICARTWPFEPESSHWWRKNPHAFDNAADLSLSTAGLVGLGFSLLPFWHAAGVLVGVAGVSVMFVKHIEIMIDEGRPRAAEITDVIHGFVYGVEMIAMLVIMTIMATSAWVVILVVYVIAGIPLLWLKRDRLLSRTEVDYSHA